ncbi:MAG: NUDIX domain-containing protein [Candidatus Peribacteria bacterium]|nr:MAG: NUDIX domain-containing protein [Candidatus Peribacteria bacterium]
MAEIINSFHLDRPDIIIPMDRDRFYDEQVAQFKKEGYPTKGVEVINIFLLNESGELILQKRASHKNHNPSLIDKSIGGHIKNGDTADFTVMLESVQELQVPSIVLRSHADFLKTYTVLEDYLTLISVIEHIDTQIVHIPKMIDSKGVVIANKTHLYMGVYGGSVKNVDKEAKGILFYSLDELKSELEQFPAMFTQDLHYYIKNYENNFREMIRFLST